MYLALDKYNLRAHVVQFSKRKAKEKREKENILQDKFNNAKQTFEFDPTDKNETDFNTAKEKLDLFYEQKLQGIIIRAQARGRVWTRWKEYEIFSQFEEKETCRKHLKKSENWRLVVRSRLIRSKSFVRKNISTKNYIREGIWVTSKQQNFFWIV